MLVVTLNQDSHDFSTLSRNLADFSVEWRIVSVHDEREVLSAIVDGGAEVVVAGIDGGRGPALFGLLRLAHPQVIRLLLMGEGGSSLPLNALESAHRLLHRPLQAEELIEAVDSIYELHELLDNEALKATVGQVTSLSAPPKLFAEITRTMLDPECSASQVADLIGQDPAIAAKVLRLCNSAYYSGGRQVTDLRGAVIRLGLETVRRLVLLTEVFTGGNGADREAIRERALRSSQLAARLLAGSSAELAATASLLSEVGRLLPGVSEDGQDGPHYAEAGAYLLGLWGLPMPIVEAVAYHPQPQRSRTRGFWVSGAVHVARALAANESVDEGYLASVSMMDKLPGWRKLADEMGALS